MSISDSLFSLRDEEYKNFTSKLIPTVDPKNIIGIRVPKLRKYAKEIYKSEEAERFLQDLPHRYYEENNLHAFLIEQTEDYDKCILRVNDFLPYIDNWSTCDIFSPKVFKKNPSRLLKELDVWIEDEHVYTVRFAIKTLMSNYLDVNFKPEFLDKTAAVRSEEYYIQMAVAWYFATALAKQYEHTIKYIECRRLSRWTHNKAIQKAVESYRIDDEKKKYLKSLKQK